MVFIRLLLCRPFMGMLALLVLEAALSATTTALIIQAAHDLAQAAFVASDFIWIVLAQSAAYGVGAVSWVFAEQAGFGAFGRYLLQFTRDNRRQTALLSDKTQREAVEPFLTHEGFHLIFELIYELEADLKLFLGLVFNAVVLGVAVDAGLPWVYAAVFAILLLMQWLMRKPVAGAYLNQQSSTNRMHAHTYFAWDNVFSGNRYNFRLWHEGFKQRLRRALRATIRSIVAREGLAALGGIIALTVVFGYLAFVVAQGAKDTALWIALAATLPRQIELSSDVHSLAAGWNDVLAIWTRMGGASRAMRPVPDADFETRLVPALLDVRKDQQTLTFQTVADLVTQLSGWTHARVTVRGPNGAGKSTLLAALKQSLGARAFYWPTSDRLVFEFARPAMDAQIDGDPGDDRQGGEQAVDAVQEPHGAARFSSGERQLRSLQEIVQRTHCAVYLLDEWDANLDALNRAQAERWVSELAQRAVVVEISHRDRQA
jgi:ABC-type transport system involved in cytochrome bd biosynthesis fused ATPase/permease subunit